MSRNKTNSSSNNQKMLKKNLVPVKTTKETSTTKVHSGMQSSSMKHTQGEHETRLVYWLYEQDVI